MEWIKRNLETSISDYYVINIKTEEMMNLFLSELISKQKEDFFDGMTKVIKILVEEDDISKIFDNFLIEIENTRRLEEFKGIIVIDISFNDRTLEMIRKFLSMIGDHMDRRILVLNISSCHNDNLCEIFWTVNQYHEFNLIDCSSIEYEYYSKMIESENNNEQIKELFKVFYHDSIFFGVRSTQYFMESVKSDEGLRRLEASILLNKDRGTSRIGFM